MHKLDNLQRARDFIVLCHKQDALSNPYPQVSGTYVQEEIERFLKPKGEIRFKEKIVSRYIKTGMHMNSEKLWQPV